MSFKSLYVVILLLAACSTPKEESPLLEEICSNSTALDNEVPPVEVTISLVPYPRALWTGTPENVELGKSAVLQACNMWSEVANISCSYSNAPDLADIYVDAFEDWDCVDGDAFVGSLATEHNHTRGIWVNTAPCTTEDLASGDPRISWNEWLTHIVAHEIGHMFGIEDVPGFCGSAVMNSNIEDHKTIPGGFITDRVTTFDRRAFLERYRTSPILDNDNDGVNVVDCNDENNNEEILTPPSDECTSGEVDIDYQESEVKLWFADTESLEWKTEILEGCSRWSQVGIKCSVVEDLNTATVVVKNFLESSCNGAVGYTYYNDRTRQYVFQVAYGCYSWLSPEEQADRIKSIAAHELAHTQGVEHVPAFCGEAIMNPHLNKRTCISDSDICAWNERQQENFLQENFLQ